MKSMFILMVIGWVSVDGAYAEKKESFLDLLAKSPAEMKEMSHKAEKDLKKWLAKLPAKERKIAKRLLNSQAKILQSGGHSLNDLLALRADVREWLKVGKQTPDYQMGIIQNGMSFTVGPPSDQTTLERKAMNYEWLVKVQDILSQEPQNVQALALKANLLINTGADDLQVIEAFKNCVKHDPTNTGCKQGYDVAVESYETLRCPDGRVKESLRFLLADEKKDGPFTEKLTNEGQTYYTLQEPSLDGRDIAHARLNFSGHEPVILMDMTPAGATKFEKLTKENIGKYVAIVLDGKAVSMPRIQAAISGGYVQISMGHKGQPKEIYDNANKLLSSICSDPQKKTLPESLRLAN